jgi:hypothetical protein
MKRMAPARPAALAALAALTFLTSLTCLVALKSGGEARLGPMVLLRLAAGYDRRAEALLAGPALLRPKSRQQAATLSQAAIEQYPYDTSAWLRLAYVDALAHGGLTAAGLANIKQSYDLVAVDSYVGLWRVRFALENSQTLTPDVRQSVRNEVSALWRNGENRGPLHEMAGAIGNPAGRLSLALWLNRLEAPVAK